MAFQISPKFILIIAAIVAFVMAFAIGANDVANAIATIVGAKTVRVRTAIIMASVMEFAGASLMGAKVTDTISKGIVDPMEFQDTPTLFMLGMFSALLSASIWLLVATYFKLPVSTTHSIVGGVIGFTVLEKGASVLNWEKIIFIASSWVVSPFLGGIIAFIVFYGLNRFILQTTNPVEQCYKWQPFLYGGCISIMGLFFVYETFPNLFDVPFYVYIVVPFGLFLIVAALVFFVLVPYLIRHEEDPVDNLELLAPKKDAETSLLSTNMLQDRLIVYKTFMPLQVLTSCLVAFAHGANDVANAVGPFAAIISIYKNGAVTAEVDSPPWLLVAGGAGIVLGLSTFGYRVLQTMGEKITHLDPPRGFAAEFSGAFTVLFASILGLPISTTHTLVGAISGVGLVKGLKNVNPKIIRNIFLSWIVTIPAGVLLSMATFAALRPLL